MDLEHVSISELPGHENRKVRLRGWLYGRRAGGGILFLLLRDGTGLCQCVVEASDARDFETARHLPQESSLAVSGTVRRDERAPGGYELAVENMEVIHSAAEYPISRKAHGVDFLLAHRHLWIRSPRQTTILKIRHTLTRAIRDFFDTRGFTLVDTPILSPGAAEGAGTLFKLDYFGQETFLTQTGQLYLESACMALGKVYCFGPTFRAEKSKTRRHLTEFWMVEPEIAFAELDDLVSLAEEFISSIVAAVLARHRSDLVSLGRNVDALENIRPPFPRMTYSEAVESLHGPRTRRFLDTETSRLQAHLRDSRQRLETLENQHARTGKGWKRDRLTGEMIALRENIRTLEEELKILPERGRRAADFRWGDDFGGDEETILSRLHDRPLIITHYPRESKAFYMKPDPRDPRLVLNMDVLAPEGYGEIIGGSQREENLDALLNRMRAAGMDPAPYEWYLDLRRYGSVPHGGFGLGIERTLAWLCGLRHVREAIAFPRLMSRIYP